VLYFSLITELFEFCKFIYFLSFLVYIMLFACHLFHWNFLLVLILVQFTHTLYTAFFLTLAIGIYMVKSLGSVNELFSRNF
jgi:hypothetical protein